MGAAIALRSVSYGSVELKGKDVPSGQEDDGSELHGDG
jgi:hypothetical protein